MTPKEKALELCQKFGYLGIKWDQTDFTTLSLENAKQCALICVEEIIPLVEGYEEALSLSQKSDELEYWQQVKTEIESL